jgi:FMN-dependent NADH-azoreductase
MPTLLQIKTSLFGDGQSTRLAQQFVDRWRAANPDGRVVTRDLTAEPVPHLSAERFTAFTTRPEERSLDQAREVAYSDRLIDELRQADVVVLGLPMYNFGPPSSLKAYFDHIARAGITFRYTDAGAQGLLGGRKVYVFAARGGIYQGTPLDTQTDYVRQFLTFLGMTDITFVYCEGLNLGPEARTRALAAARLAVDELTI